MGLEERKIRFRQLDVFTEKPLAGNPLAVFYDADMLSSDLMLKIALEMNLSETTFVQTPTTAKADYRNRIFTRTGEIPFAGHPSIGTAYALVQEGRIKLKSPITTIHQEVGIGVLPLDIYLKGDRIDKIIMTQGAPEFGRTIEKEDLERVAKAKGIDLDEIKGTRLTPQVVSTGLSFLIVPVKSLEAVRNPGQPDLAELDYLRKKYSFRSASLFTLETFSKGSFAHVRYYNVPGMNEDPATGSNAGCLGAYLMKWGVLPQDENPYIFTLEQGNEVNRPSEIIVEVYHKDRVPVKIRVGGKAVTVLEGTLFY